MTQISRQEYAGLFGPTVGDKIRLGDTDLYIEIERDLRVLGDEAIYGGGKTLRDGMGVNNQLTSEGGALDLVITNVTVLDAVLGVVKADVGIKDGLIVGIGKAGNSGTMDGVTPGLDVGPATDAISGEQLILTAGGIDTHVHYIAPQQAYAALSNGVTTFFGGGIGPSDSSNGTSLTPGPWHIEMMLRAIEGLPVNVGILGKGAAGEAALVEQALAGAAGFKIHEDWGATPAIIRAALAVADRMDVQVSIHTDTQNEAGFVEDTIAAFDGRTIHTFHSEGAGGGHSPDLLRVVGEDNVLPSSTTPTLPFGINTPGELFDMIMVVHNLNPRIPSDVAFTESRIRAETMAAENFLQDLGAISMIQSDSQAMGRVGENWLRVMHTADAMKGARQAARGRRGPRQLPRAAVRREDHHQPGHHGRRGAGDRLGRARQTGRPGAMGAGLLRRQTEDDHQGRDDQLVADGRPERVGPHARAGLLPPDVRRVRHGPAADVRQFRLSGRVRSRGGRAAPAPAAGAAGRADPDHHQARSGPQQRSPGHHGRPGDVRRDRRRRAGDRARGQVGQPQPAVLLQLAGERP